MSIALRSGLAGNNGTGGASITLTKPTGVVDGDVMVMGLTVRGGTGTSITPPTPSWTLKSNPVTSDAPATAYGNGRWVTVGLWGTSPWAYSDDGGQTWSSLSNPFPSGTSYAIIYANNKWFACGNVGYFGRSANGIDWTVWKGNDSTGILGNYTLYSLAYGNGRLVAGGDGQNDSIYSDDDGTTWARSTGITGSNSVGLAYGNGYFVLVNQSSEIYYSANGASFTENTTHSFTGYIDCVHYANGVWVAGGGYAGTAGEMATATDPTGTWTMRSNPFGYNISGVTYDAVTATWWAGGYDGSYAAQVASATDPTGTWSLQSNPHGSDRVNGVGVGRGDLVFVGNTAKVSRKPGRWSLLNRTDSTTTLGQALYWKVASGEPSSWDIGMTSCLASGAIIALSDAAVDLPVAAQYAGQANASSANVVAPALGSWASISGIDVGLFGTAYGSSFTPPADYTEPSSSDSASTGTTLATTSEGSYRALSSVTTVGSITAVAANAAVNIGYHIFIKQSSATEFVLGLAPLVIEVEKGSEKTVDITTTLTKGVAETITMSAVGLPTGLTVDFDPVEVTTGNSSVATISMGQTATEGDVVISIVGTSALWGDSRALTVKQRNAPASISVHFLGHN